MRTRLVDIAGRHPAPRLGGLVAELEVEPAQTGDGLRARVSLANRGELASVLLNPLVLIQFALQDGAGYPVPLPEKPSPLLVNAFGAEDWTFAGGPPVVVATWNGNAVASNQLEGERLRLAAGDEIAAVFLLDRALGATPTLGAAEFTIPIPGGRYAIGCLLTLIDAEQPALSRILEATPLAARFTRQ